MAAPKKEAQGVALPPLDVVDVLEKAGVIPKYMDLVRSLLARLPAGIQPTDEQLSSLFAEAMQGAPGAIREALKVLPLQLAQALLKGRGPVSKDSSALA